VEHKGPIAAVKIGPCGRVSALENVDTLVGEDFGAKRFNDGIRNIDPIAGPGVGHSGFAGSGCRDNRSTVATFFRVFYGAIVTLAGVPVGIGPGRNPG
jgi:hypothetical protein